MLLSSTRASASAKSAWQNFILHECTPGARPCRILFTSLRKTSHHRLEMLLVIWAFATDRRPCAMAAKRRATRSVCRRPVTIGNGWIVSRYDENAVATSDVITISQDATYPIAGMALTDDPSAST